MSESNHRRTRTLSICLWCVDNPSIKFNCDTCCTTTTTDNNVNEVNCEILKFPGPGIVKHAENFGNYIVASRRIEKGELIIEEKPLLVSPYGTSEMMPYCLSCYKDISLSAKCKCSKCKWPVCDKNCEMSCQHVENECEIFTKHGVRPKGISTDYFAVEVLRGLLLRGRSPKKWARLLQLESHVEARKNVLANITRDFVLDFIFNKCNLKEEYSEEIVDRILGVLSVNTFWGYADLHRYVSILFDKITLFNHDCDPNTSRRLIKYDDEELKPQDQEQDINNNNNNVDENEESDCYSNSGIRLRVTAAKTIEAGDQITIQYVDCSLDVQERRQELKELFYFDCSCTKCIVDLTQVVSLHDDNLSL